MVFDIAFWKILVAAVVWFIIGAVWYSPVLFAKPWRAALGKQNEEMKMSAGPMITTFLAQLLMVVVLAWFANATGVPTVLRGAYLGFKIWLFVALAMVINSSFQGGNRKLLGIDAGYHLVGLVVAGAILAS
jgi:hypothetical protein